MISTQFDVQLHEIELAVSQLRVIGLPPLSSEAFAPFYTIPDSQRSGIETSAKEVHDTLNKRHETLRVLENMIGALRVAAFLQAMQPLSAMSQISCLPPEVLMIVFQYAAETHEDANTLSAVCRRWREITLSQPAIWSTIQVRGLNKLVNKALSLSGNRKIFLSNWNSDPHAISHDISSGIRAKLSRAVVRVGFGAEGLNDLDEAAGTGVHGDPLGFPYLEDLTIEFEERCSQCLQFWATANGRYTVDASAHLERIPLPSLRRLTLKRSSFEPDIDPLTLLRLHPGNYPSLVHLDLDSLSLPMSSQFTDLLRACPNIEYLRVRNAYIEEDSVRTPATLHSLRHLTLHGSFQSYDCSTVILSIDAPNLESFTLSGTVPIWRRPLAEEVSQVSYFLAALKIDSLRCFVES